jgi:hypothetical protein
MKLQLVVLLLVAQVLLACGDSGRQPASDNHSRPVSPVRASSRSGEGQPKSARVVSPTDRSYEVKLAAGASCHEVYESSKRDEIVLLELSSDRIVFTALISRRKYEEVMALRPPTYFEHKGREYVKNQLFFWGKAGKSELVSVDGKEFKGFTLRLDDMQVAAEGASVGAVLDALAEGNELRLEKHYWNDAGNKAYPTYKASAFAQRLSQLTPSTALTLTVRESETRCKSYGPRKVIWLDHAQAVIALNGQAMEFALNGELNGSKDIPWQAAGRPVLIGRDVLGPSVTQQLIKSGLKKCE